MKEVDLQKAGVESTDSANQNVLSEPVKHTLIEIFKELQYGRPKASQDYLKRKIEELEFWGSVL